MLTITHTTPRRVLGHLKRLERAGNALLASYDQLTPLDDGRWEQSFFKLLGKIVTDPNTVDALLFVNYKDYGLSKNPPPSTKREALNQITRCRISRTLVTIASFIEKVEAYTEAQEAEKKMDASAGS